MTRSSVVAVCICLVACGPAADVQDEAEVMETDRAFARATAARGVEGWVSYFAEDGIMVSGLAVVIGQDSIRALMTPAFADSTYSLRWEPTRAEVAGSGDLWYTLGTFESRRTDADGNVVIRTGSYLTVWRREQSGEWKVALDIGSPDEAPPDADGNSDERS